MAGGNPKKLAHDVAQGYQQLTAANLRAYPGGELQALFFNLQLVLREIRGFPIPLVNKEALKEKNVKIQRLNQAIQTVRSYSASQKIKL